MFNVKKIFLQYKNVLFSIPLVFVIALSLWFGFCVPVIMPFAYFIIMTTGSYLYKQSFFDFIRAHRNINTVMCLLHLSYFRFFGKFVINFFWFSQSPYVLYASLIYLGCFLFHCLTDMIERNLYLLNSLILGFAGFCFSKKFLKARACLAVKSLSTKTVLIGPLAITVLKFAN